jgi:polysaccharide biosynthesis transport protein
LAAEKVENNDGAISNERALVRRGQPHPVVYSDGYAEDYGYGYGESQRPNEPQWHLRDLWRVVGKHKWLILSLTLIATGILAVEILRIRHTYTAFSILEIRKEAPSLVTPVADADPENLVSIKTKLLMFSSRPLLEDVIVQSRLNQNPGFQDVAEKRSRWEVVKSIGKLGLLLNEPPPAAPADTTLPFGALTLDDASQAAYEPVAVNLPAEHAHLDRFVSILEQHLTVEHLKDTQALKISFTHRDPKIAALVANGLAQSFVKANFQSRTESYSATSSWLDRSTRALKARVEQADEDLARYSRENNIYSEGKTKLATDKLVRMHDQATRAEIDLQLKRSLYEEVEQGRVAQLPDSFTDTRIIELQRKLNEISITAAQLELTYGPDNPKVQDVQQQMAKIREQIAESRTALEGKIKSDYSRALRDDDSLKQALAQAKSEAVEQDQASVQYNILKQEVDTSRALYNELLQKASHAELDTAKQKSNINIIRPARVPRLPDGPNHGLTILLGFMVSLGASVGLAFGFEYFDNTIRNADDVNRYVQLPTLGIIPAIASAGAKRLTGLRADNRKSRLSIISPEAAAEESEDLGNYFLRFLPPSETSKQEPEKLIAVNQNSSIAEAYRALRISLMMPPEGDPPKTILFTSGWPGEGKTTTIVNTAISLAQLGASVLIIDADLRKPAAHKGLSVKYADGLSTCLSEGGDIDAVIQRLSIPGLSLLPCGPIPVNPAELISSPRLKEMLSTLATRYDHLLIDSPPLMYVTDPLILANQVEGVVLIVQGGQTARDVVRQSCQMLSQVGAKILGVVLNKIDLRDQMYRDSCYYPSQPRNSRASHEGRISDIIN